MFAGAGERRERPRMGFSRMDAVGRLESCRHGTAQYTKFGLNTRSCLYAKVSCIITPTNPPKQPQPIQKILFLSNAQRVHLGMRIDSRRLRKRNPLILSAAALPLRRPVGRGRRQCSDAQVERPRRRRGFPIPFMYCRLVREMRWSGFPDPPRGRKPPVCPTDRSAIPTTQARLLWGPPGA